MANGSQGEEGPALKGEGQSPTVALVLVCDVK